jgi:hypothetical protein
MKTSFTDHDFEHFLNHGWVHLPQVFDAGPGTVVDRWREESWARAGLDKNDSASWPNKPKVLRPATDRVRVREFAPAAWEGITRIMGGPERMHHPDFWWDNAFLMNYAVGADEPLVPCGPQSPVGINWHVDGIWFRHFLDSPEQGILGVVLWDDMVSGGGATCIAPDSIGVVADYLRRHPEGVEPNDFPWDEIIAVSSTFLECTGKAGDVFLLHPFTMHRGAQNPLRRPRFMTNIVTSFKEPLRFDRSPQESSAIELAVLRALGVDRIDFHITGERARYQRAGMM